MVRRLPAENERFLYQQVDHEVNRSGTPKERSEMHIVAGSALALFLGVIFIAYIVFVISALIGIVASRLGFGAKILWLLVIFAIPFLGSLLWHLVGKKSDYARR